MDRADNGARARDATAATAVLGAVLALLQRQGGLDALRDPVAAGAGLGCGLAVEWAFFRYPERLLRLWDQPLVAVASAATVLGAAWRCRRSPRLLAAAVWGLLPYFALLARACLGGE
jgi:hypothetical protein